jgi:putative drug exporter of the RND superfamily
VHSAGPGGLLVAFIDAFSGIDGSLLLAAGAVVILILLIVYRSPVLWFFPLFCACPCRISIRPAQATSRYS